MQLELMLKTLVTLVNHYHNQQEPTVHHIVGQDDNEPHSVEVRITQMGVPRTINKVTHPRATHAVARMIDLYVELVLQAQQQVV